MEMILILATVAQRYRLQWHGARPVVPLPSITLRPKGGIRVSWHPALDGASFICIMGNRLDTRAGAA
jgi:hypothetical protein